MILELYSIYDKKLGEFLPPFCCKNEEDAIRMCSNLVNHSDSLMLKFPEDYDCNLVGKFDTEQGSIENLDIKDIANFSQPSIEFKNLVKDETTKYKDILNNISGLSGKIDSKLLLLSDKINKLDSLNSEYSNKFDKLANNYKAILTEASSNSSVSNVDKSVDTPDFLPTNNPKSKKSFLDKLFS